MTTVHRLSCRDARRIAVRAQLLDKTRPTELIDVVRHLTMLPAEGTTRELGLLHDFLGTGREVAIRNKQPTCDR